MDNGRGIMAINAETGIHAYIDELCRRGFYGETTFYFQNGEIGNVRETARLGKKDIVERYNGDAPIKTARRVAVAARRETSKGAV
jgi:hypothetical protein